MPRNPSCTACPLHRTTTNVCVWGGGSATAKIMIVGEAPGADEERQGTPFVGAAGRVLNAALEQAGLSRGEVYVTNTVKCRPPNNRTPDSAEAAACLGYLLEEIETMRPALIVPLGNAALAQLTDHKAITKVRGKKLALRHGLPFDTPVLPTIHPAATLYGGGGATASNPTFIKIVEDLRTAKSMITERADYARTYVLPGDDDVSAIRQLHAAKAIAADVEWTHGDKSMLWPWTGTGELYSVSLTGRIDGALSSVGIAYPPTTAVREALLELFAAKALVFHNAMADGLWMSHERLKPKIGADTMLLAYLHDEKQELNLEAVATRYGRDVTPGWKGGTRSTRPSTPNEWRDLLLYNMHDTEATLLAFEGICETAKADGRYEAILRLHNKLLIPALRLLLKSAYVGVPFDREALALASRAADERMMAAAEELAEAAGIGVKQAIKLAGSSQQKKQYLKGQFQIDVDSARKEDLQELVRYPAVAAMLKYTKEQKLVSTYLKPWETMLERQGDGRIHTIYRLGKTRTGRLSSESEIGGPLQVTPRAKWIRELFKATPGRKILSADYSTVEMRIAAWRANEPTMLRMFNEGYDLHRVTAGYIVACRESIMPIQRYLKYLEELGAAGLENAVSTEDRQNGKIGNFGLTYGMQDEKFQTYARTQYRTILTREEAHMMRNSYFQLYPALLPWHQREMANAERLGYTETVFGRRRSFVDSDPFKAINTPVQSTASDLTLLAMTQASERFRAERLDAVIIGFVHDSVLVDVADAHAERARDLLVSSMENVDTSAFGFKVPVPLPADSKLAQTWS